EGRAGFNLEFLPATYFGKTYMMDDQNGLFPSYPSGPMKSGTNGLVEARPLATGKKMILAPEDPLCRIGLVSETNDLQFFDGRNKAQNGWFVVRSLIPAGKTGKVIEWKVTANTIPGWTRTPVITHSQVGYHPDQNKTAVIELDRNSGSGNTARLLRVTGDGQFEEAFANKVITWGNYLRYNYVKFDFSIVTDPGVYIIEFEGDYSDPFRIDRDMYEDLWQPTLDVFFPVQMDHMFVNEAYRVWHGAAHLDDARQAPVDHEHFDLYAQGNTTDTRFKPGEHIPGLNVGGWFDAGDYDIRTQSQYSVVLSLVRTWERFRPERDETRIDQEERYVDIHVPDGIPDMLQQIEHGVIALLAQHRSVGHAIPGIIVPDLSQYTHLGDAVTMTDNMIYNPEMDPHESDGLKSGNPDDRWAFTSKSSSLNYGSAAALAAASRVLKGYNDVLAAECLSTAVRVWDEEHQNEPSTFRHGNTTGGRLEHEELKTAVELAICTGEGTYSTRISELLSAMEERFPFYADLAIKAMPFMDDSFSARVKNAVVAYADQLDSFDQQNPFGVPITTGGWAGNGSVIRFVTTNYILHKAFPDIVDKEFVCRGLNYIFGCHPGSNVSFVSGIGARSSQVAYGSNRADFSYIAGGLVPGVLILPPDFPENKLDWPFLWGENEYTIGVAASYIFAVNAVNDLFNEPKQ
ncbi:MAG: glycoside hydrolase family 9 protein, partial [Bacteroidales bacterium]|nr:glycoside hydrolase family 9 protein [Bacteroidales bacterium]